MSYAKYIFAFLKNEVNVFFWNIFKPSAVLKKTMEFRIKVYFRFLEVWEKSYCSCEDVLMSYCLYRVFAPPTLNYFSGLSYI